MNLGEVFEHLAHGELSNVFAGNLEDGQIKVEHRRRIASHISLGLTTLHERFLLREGSLTIKLQPEKFTYLLDKDYVVGSRCTPCEVPEEVKYIVRTDPPFDNDLFKVERVYDSNGHEQLLNVAGNRASIITPTYRTLEIPECIESETLVVKYRQNHPKLEPYLLETAPEHIPIDLPMPYLRPLLLFVASRAFDPLGAAGDYHEGNFYWGKFEGACRDLVNLNYQRDPEGEIDNYQLGGWV